MNPLRLVIVDDHAIVRDGLRRVLELQPGLSVVGEASNGRDALEVIGQSKPDVALMDLSMPGLSGIDATRTLRDISPSTRILALTVHEGEGYVREFLRAGAQGYLLKRATTEELVRAIRAVASNDVYVDSRVSRSLLRELIAPQSAGKSHRADLSERETEVLRRIALGYANKEIAAQLEVSVKSIETYRMRAMEKLGLKDRVDIVRLAIERGWLGP